MSLINNIKRDLKRGPVYKGTPVKNMAKDKIKKELRALREHGFVGHGDQQFYISGPEPSGDGACAAYEQECAYVLEATPNKWIDIFEAELENRGIDYDGYEEDSMSIY